MKQHISVAPVQGLVVRLPEEAAMLPATQQGGAHAASAETAANDALDASTLMLQPGAPLQDGQASSALAANEAQAFEVLPAPHRRKGASGAERVGGRNRTDTDPGEAELAALLRPPPLPPFLRHGS